MNKMKHRAVVLACLAALLLVSALLVQSWMAPPKARPEEVVIKIESGAGAREISTLLEKSGLVKSGSFFHMLLRISGNDKKMQAGTYRIRVGTRVSEMIAMFVEGKTARVQVTIPEGYTARAIGKLLENAGICSANAFLEAAGDAEFARQMGLPAKNFEGFLFPDTYFFDEDSSAKTVVQTMVEAFFKKVRDIAPDSETGGQSFYDKVVLASIVEREYRIPEEAGLIASVFTNRLKIGMPLQSCATVVYVITEKLNKPHPSVVYFSDLSIRDPYNTYLHRGLPPGPICNPGAVALSAVFNPQKSEYLYFRLVDAQKGTHRFSKTFEEHSQAAIPVKGF